MKLNYNNYKKRRVCPVCFSLAIKITSKKKNEYKCYNCNTKFKMIFEVELMHKGNRCIDNNVNTREQRYNVFLGRVIYE